MPQGKEIHKSCKSAISSGLKSGSCCWFSKSRLFYFPLPLSGSSAEMPVSIRRNILLGKDEDFSDHPSVRWKNLLVLAFGQKKMFRNPLVAVLHFFIYAGFIIINLEVLEIFLDGLFGTHRLFVHRWVVLQLADQCV